MRECDLCRFFFILVHHGHGSGKVQPWAGIVAVLTSGVLKRLYFIDGRSDELEIKLQAQHHTPRQLEYMAHKRASRFKAHLAEKIHTGSPDKYQGCGGSCAICLEDMTSGGMCYKLNTGGMEHVFHRVCGEQQM